ncbi:hypothetical protein N9B31_04485 [Mariniblastus sp.]|jgi:hypothetical protein|nr:hypothetical protein [Mariniblastus sp.]MDA7901707.1 hypothetical protein [bacterium]MDA7902897.1 hypothetical protein [Mariniblastus sp.]MDA7925274.1 hypothetical protein [Mariniblastus sp.]MDB4564355.1 hypothetical protein [Mariniblastus sp.]
MKESIRKNRLLVDWKFQGALCLRVSFYWLLCQTTLVATMLGFLALEAQADLHPYDGSASPWRFIMPAIVGSSVFLPLVLLDNLRMSNRIARSFEQFRNTLNQLCERQQSESDAKPTIDIVGDRKDAAATAVTPLDQMS